MMRRPAPEPLSEPLVGYGLTTELPTPPNGAQYALYAVVRQSPLWTFAWNEAPPPMIAEPSHSPSEKAALAGAAVNAAPAAHAAAATTSEDRRRRRARDWSGMGST